MGAVPQHPARAQLAPPSTGGVTALDRALQNLAEQRRVLMIAAHPDDEDTDLLAMLSLGYGAQTAYLSLNRGEGGQNLIGEELGPGLGLIRSQELLSAREIDGATQFFTRTFDYGFSRTLDEAQRFWPSDSVLKDVVRVIRRFRPHVMVSVFSGTPADGHGQHQDAGWVTPLAFAAAGDAAKFPELKREEGLEPWQPLKLYRSTRFNRQTSTMDIATGTLDARTGKTYHQIAMASRSRHRSQDMGQLQRSGPFLTGVRLVESRVNAGVVPSGEKSIFDGIPNGDLELARLADSLRRGLSPERMSEVARPIAEMLATINGGSAGRRAGGSRTPNQRDTDPSIRRSAEQALGIASGLVIDAVASDAELIPGQQFEVEATLYNSGPYPIDVDFVSVAVPGGWKAEATTTQPASVPPGQQVSRKFAVTVPAPVLPGEAAQGRDV